MNKTILIGLVFMFSLIAYADEYYEPLTLQEFSLLNDTELTNWNATLEYVQAEGQDDVYYFSINTYFYWDDGNGTSWVIPARLTFYTQCYEELDCSSFYDSELENIKEYEFSYFKEIQEEYE